MGKLVLRRLQFQRYSIVKNHETAKLEIRVPLRETRVLNEKKFVARRRKATVGDIIFQFYVASTCKTASYGVDK